MSIQVTIYRRANRIGEIGKIKSVKFRPICGHTPVSLASRTPMGRRSKGVLERASDPSRDCKNGTVTLFEQEAFLIKRRGF